MLLIVGALLISAAQDTRAVGTGQIFPLDMATDSVDYQYKDCTMTDKVENYLQKERSASEEFNKAWNEGEQYITKPEGSLTRDHLVAIHVYTNKDSPVYSSFTKATRSEKDKYIEGTFQWYSLHFLLTKAIEILKTTQPGCFVTYRGTNLILEARSREVRLSSFSSSSLNQTVIQGFGNKSCFEIYTCHGANLTKYSKYPEEQEVLIPPYETFKVTEEKKRSDFKDLWCDTVFVLKSTGARSEPSCGVFNDGGHVAFLNTLLILPMMGCLVMVI